MAERQHFSRGDYQIARGYPSFPLKETAVCRMAYRESVAKELDNPKFAAGAETLRNRNRQQTLEPVAN
jgi:hypothetical protein